MTSSRATGAIAAEPIAARRVGASPLVTMFAAATLVVLTVCAAGMTVWKIHEQVDREARANLGKLALVIADQTSRSFQSVDVVLREVAARFSADGLNTSNGLRAGLGSKISHEFLVEQARHLLQIRDLALINADGELINSSRGWPAPTAMIGDREHFRHLRDNNDDTLFISEPVRSRVDGAWTIYLNRRLNGPQNEFLGIAEASVPIDQLAQFYKAVDLGEGSGIALWRRDGTLLARYPVVESLIGSSLKNQMPFGEADENLDHGGVLMAGRLDGVSRYIAFAAVRDFPLVVAVTKTEDVVLGSWRRDAAILLVGALGAVTGALVLLLALAAQIRGMRRSEKLLALRNLQLERSSYQLLEAQRIGNLGHWISDAPAVAIWSPQLFEIAGLPQMPAVPIETMLSLVHPEDTETFQRMRNEARASGTKLVHEHRWIRPDGGLRWVRLEADPRLDAEGRFIGLFGVIKDITGPKLAEAVLDQRVAELELARNHLETQKRELITTTADLRVARDAAQSANRAKSDFLAMMSHEIRTPMTGMIGMVDLLSEATLDEDRQRYAELARRSAQSLLDVINNILDFSKLEAGRMLPESIDFDVRQLIEDAASLLRKKAQDQGLDLKVSLTPQLPKWLKGDPGRIRQILLNLISNAVKFTERGSVEIGASHRTLADETIELRVEVADSGIWILPDVQERLFNPFVQADTSISRKYGGSGLGLAICKQLCAMMDGAIGLDSVQDRGSTFWFTVKCKPGEPFVEAPLVPLDGSSRPLQILVAEDSPIIAKLISSLLARQGFQAEMVADGMEAVAAVRHNSYDLVLMDIQMPTMDGISAATAIRKLAGPQREVPIIALTANALPGQRECYLAAGMNDCVTKPIRPPALFAAINRWAASRRSDDLVDAAVVPALAMEGEQG